MWQILWYWGVRYLGEAYRHNCSFCTGVLYSGRGIVRGKRGSTPVSDTTATTVVQRTLQCKSARARQRNTEVWTTITHQESLLKLKDLEHGFRLSINMYKSAVQERLATTKWREGFGPIPATLPVATQLQCFHRMSYTFTSNRAIKWSAKACGVRLNTYHGENGVLKSK